ncbi:MAG TPA: regulatory iron-sulfur-containing complex subunit RicT [Phnomibacter sp.]|nr:regulatory iron-sulfur-containing complex subunit RicT [Phnomibacter sp.]
MGCSGCGTATGGKPNGCKSNGGCSSGGCNRMNVHDWLMNLPFSDPESSCRVVEVSFNQGSRKEHYRNTTLQHFDKGELVTVEGVSGFDVGEVSLTGELVRLQLKKNRIPEDSAEMKRILRRANHTDIEKWRESKGREREMLVRSRASARSLGLQMKLAEVELQADGKKATFFYTADDRVDFRELIKIYANDFRVKVEMRQIGARQEAGKVGGIGSCGRELCCSTWLTDFKSVNTQAARYQNLSINQTKLSGQCGRLKCCLNYELDTYLDALQHFPTHCDVLEVTRGRAFLAKKDIFRNLMWYTLPDSTRQYPLTIARVLEIKAMNQQGQKPDELQAVEVVSTKPREVEPEFVDVVGQISLRSLEKTSRRNRDKEQSRNREQQKGREQQRPRGGEAPRGGGGPKPGGSQPQQQQQGQKPPQGQQQPRRPDQKPPQPGQGGGKHKQRHKQRRPDGGNKGPETT